MFNLTLAQGQTLYAHSWYVTDDNLNPITAYKKDEVRSIASLTKLITVMVAIDDGQADPILVEDAMVRSSNVAATLLCKKYSKGYRACIAAMNAKVQSLGTTKTVLVEPTGLSHKNKSTAHDIALIVNAASRYPAIVAASHRRLLHRGKLTFKNTNPTVDENTVVSKTGWTMASGGCIAVMHNHRIYVILGSRDTRTRVNDLLELRARYDRPCSVPAFDTRSLREHCWTNHLDHVMSTECVVYADPRPANRYCP
jgi:D-alanyl-D-alanine carboxypeptidase